ncbi:SDR family oxidoreductase [Nocardia sp. XZ_19_369]|uniref:SDR family oxidoreductase n=1 Tax=Nocardia sp. XZ_19_369 TaxID=2769487 RepID=UPI00188FB433|nr:SDR family oxidoreductase [Nocardia sp. XZ_19_369]
MGSYLLTGATGFVGGALTLELLEKTGAPIHLVVRDGASGAEGRCLAALRVAAESYGRDRDFIDRHQDRLHVAAGDLLSAEIVKRLPAHGITDVWHCAASLEFEDRNRDKIFAVNVDGTRRLLDLSEKLGVARFNYMSTAYVAGAAVGKIVESAVADEVNPNNQYELSKIVAEGVVAQRESMRTRIWRPSIVVGHSKTYAATSFTGLYGLIREACLFKRRVEKVFGPNFVMQQRRILADPAAQINLIPVDLLVQQAVSLSMRLSLDESIVHLTNGSAPTMRDFMAVMSSMTGIPEPEYVTSAAGFTAVERRFHNAMRFYAPHVEGAKAFAQDVAERHGSPLHFPMDQDYQRALIGWYLDYAGLANEVRAT